MFMRIFIRICVNPCSLFVDKSEIETFAENDDEIWNDPSFQPNKDPATKLLEVWKKGQVYLDIFWEVWQDEYLLSLREKLPLS